MIAQAAIFLGAHIAIAFIAATVRSAQVSPGWHRASYTIAAVVLFWLCYRMLGTL